MKKNAKNIICSLHKTEQKKWIYLILNICQNTHEIIAYTYNALYLLNCLSVTDIDSVFNNKKIVYYPR